jgi:hypothetical protein
MKGRNKIAGFLICLLTLLVSCQKTVISDRKEYLTYLADPKNGLLTEKVVAGIKMTVKYVPEDYLVYNTVKDLPACSQHDKDSIAGTYHNSLTFMVNIGPAENENFDLTRVGVDNYGEFAERIEEMAFNSQNWFSLSSEGKLHSPTITRMENLNALEKSRNFIVVFSSAFNSDQDLRKKDMTFIYTDDLFNTGVHKFQFATEDIKRIPTFKF